jgi:hypothetical protein
VTFDEYHLETFGFKKGHGGFDGGEASPQTLREEWASEAHSANVGISKPSMRGRGTTGLTAEHRQMAMMHVANMDHASIAQWFKTSPGRVSDILAKPHVQQLVLQLMGNTVEQLKPGIEHVNDLIVQSTEEAIKMEVDLMRRSYEQATSGDISKNISSAQLSFTIQKDLLDRAGAMAPKRLETKNLSMNISSEHLMGIRQVLEELGAI